MVLCCTSGNCGFISESGNLSVVLCCDSQLICGFMLILLDNSSVVSCCTNWSDSG